jgi:tetratricopeptide (TPR) repeat protein
MGLFFAMAIAAMQEASPAPMNVPVIGQGVTATAVANDSPDSARIDEAFRIIRAGRPAEAIPILDSITMRLEKLYAGEKRQIFSSSSLKESFVYAALSAKTNKDSLVLDENWGMAHFLKGFALIDLGRAEEAKVQLDRAIALAPVNAQFLAERAEWHKSRKDWTKAIVDFEAASRAAEFSPDAAQNSHKARALRGIGFVKIELGDLKEAEKLFKQSLKIDPDSANARQELEYIKSLKRN